MRTADELEEALKYTEREMEEWKRKFGELEKSKDVTEAQRIRWGDSIATQFKETLQATSDSLAILPEPVREAIYQTQRGSILPYPNISESPSYVVSDFDDAVERKMLVEEGEGTFAPNPAKAKVAEALEAVDALQVLMHDEASDDFIEWFVAEYDNLAPDLKDRDCWEKLFG